MLVQGKLTQFPELNHSQHTYNKIEIMTSFEMHPSSRYNHVYSHNCKWYVVAPWRGKVKRFGCYTKAWDAAAVADLACIQQVAEVRCRTTHSPHVSSYKDMKMAHPYSHNCEGVSLACSSDMFC
jgi:hypothetical protein